MTAHKPRVYVMESQSFTLTPPTRLFLTRGSDAKEKWCKCSYTGAPYFWRCQWRCAETAWGEHPEKGANAHSRNHGHTHTKNPGFNRNVAAWGLKEMKTGVGAVWPRQASRFAGETNWTWSGNVVSCWGYHCSSLSIGCILPWLLMLCRSTLLSSEWWTNRQWFSPRKSTVVYCLHVSCVFVYWRPVSSRCDTCNFQSIFSIVD